MRTFEPFTIAAMSANLLLESAQERTATRQKWWTHVADERHMRPLPEFTLGMSKQAVMKDLEAWSYCLSAVERTEISYRQQALPWRSPRQRPLWIQKFLHAYHQHEWRLITNMSKESQVNETFETVAGLNEARKLLNPKSPHRRRIISKTQ